jgi:hypothetical protein
MVATREHAAHGQTAPSSANIGVLPSGITAGTPVAEVVKLVQAGVGVGVIQSYISGCPDAFNLDADQIIALTDAGVSSDLVNSMMAHDKNLSASGAPPLTTPAPAPVDEVNATPPTTDMTLNDFNNALAPYGQWVQVDGYGRCWRPTVVIYDSAWQPYCDRGRWVYTDCGWYWDSNYSWGVTFHYGRWFNHPHYGWCWWPETVWAPSWVTWRSSSDYCGWAPLPPFTAYQPGIGFTYRGANVSVGFDFGLAAGCFTFVSADHFCDPHPRNFRVPHQHMSQIYNQCSVVNNYNFNHHTIVNNGISVTLIGSAYHHDIPAVSVTTLSHPSRYGSQSQGMNHSAHSYGSGATDSSFTRPPANTGFQHEGSTQHGFGNGANLAHSTSYDHTGQSQSASANNPVPAHNQISNGSFPHDSHQPVHVNPPPDASSTAPNAWAPAGTRPPSNTRFQHEGSTPNGSGNGATINHPPSYDRSGQSQPAPANNPAPAHNQISNGSFPGESHQPVHVYPSPDASAAAPNAWAPAGNSHPALPSETHRQPEPANPPTSFASPSGAPSHSPREESHQDGVQSAPHPVQSAAPERPAPAQNQNPSANAGGKPPGWGGQNH